MDDYIELNSVHDRMKRYLIPITGKSLSCLVGTATQSDLRTIWINVEKLANKQKRVHVTTVTNVTWIEMAENRQTVNKIIASLSNLNAKLGNFTQTLDC